jgi:hypothetical protein
MKLLSLLVALLSLAALPSGLAQPTAVPPQPKLANLSARIFLQPGGKPQVIGFVVKEQSPEVQRVRILVRAVGGSLAQFGVANPASAPRLSFFTASGQEFILYSPIGPVFGPDSWARIFATVGAFPLGPSEIPYVSYSVGSLVPGGYTVHVTDSDGRGGEVLVEVYEFPAGVPLL